MTARPLTFAAGTVNPPASRMPSTSPAAAAGDPKLERLKRAPPNWSLLMAIKFGRPLERSRTRIEADTQPPADRLDLTIRPRRNRRAEWARRMVREHVLTTDDLIWPLFLVDGKKVRVPVASMPD